MYTNIRQYRYNDVLPQFNKLKIVIIVIIIIFKLNTLLQIMKVNLSLINKLKNYNFKL